MKIPGNNHIDNLEWCTYKYNINYGTAIERRSKSKSKKVVCINTGKTFNSIKEATEWCNLKGQGIIHQIKGKQKTAGKHPVTGEKLVWRYLNDEK